MEAIEASHRNRELYVVQDKLALEKFIETVGNYSSLLQQSSDAGDRLTGINQLGEIIKVREEHCHSLSCLQKDHFSFS